ncbi:hypothetical protein [Mesobacillus boroniphilus]|uniref:Ribosomal-protein-L7p-serine acetyltransferase n=1 Tax=Mesobacillus boroniphilus JCM 21738 TaxID=1294265 RepID=W4RL73_9BACI|nr:ribosomal-protein-L7p-serine acetyltransferase [Mesobacillus boroniphilus JCM 21738]
MLTLKVDSELELRIFEPREAGELFWLLDSNRRYLREWLPWIDGIQSPGQFYSVIQMWQKNFQEGSSSHFGIRYRGALAGSISSMLLTGITLRQASATTCQKNCKAGGLQSERRKQ